MTHDVYIRIKSGFYAFNVALHLPRQKLKKIKNKPNMCITLIKVSYYFIIFIELSKPTLVSKIEFRLLPIEKSHIILFSKFPGYSSIKSWLHQFIILLERSLTSKLSFLIQIKPTFKTFLLFILHWEGPMMHVVSMLYASPGVCQKCCEL